MYNLSLTACSFYFKKTNSKENTNILNLNTPFDIELKDDIKYHFKDLSELFISFFENHKTLIKNDNKQQSFRCEYDKKNYRETDSFRMYCVKILSGIYGSSSDIIDGNTEKVQYEKKLSDIDTRPFYLMIIFPKDNEKVTVQKGMFLFQNVGQFGVKTITTTLMQKFFSDKFGFTLKCNTIASDLFVRKVIRKDSVKKLLMIKNVKSNDIADNIGVGYGSEIREISKLCFNETMWSKIMDKIRFVSGGKYNLFEFEQQEYDNLKVVVDIGGRNRTINLHNLENLSIIESIPDNIRMANGHPNLPMLIEYFQKVATEYLKEMVLHIS